MAMPSTIEIADPLIAGQEKDIDEVFSYFHYIDNIFSTYKNDSIISKINRNEIDEKDYPETVIEVFELIEQTRQETKGYFSMYLGGQIDPSGLVKGYAIHQGADILRKKGYKNFYVEIAGDSEVVGKKNNEKWKVGILNPFNLSEIIQVVSLENQGIATSGNYQRGSHIYNPVTGTVADAIASMSVIANNVYDADRFATAAFAMGEKGIYFLENLDGVEGYMVKRDKTSIQTTGWEKYEIH